LDDAAKEMKKKRVYKFNLIKSFLGRQSRNGLTFIKKLILKRYLQKLYNLKEDYKLDVTRSRFVERYLELPVDLAWIRIAN
jgi:hypothetical protein